MVLWSRLQPIDESDGEKHALNDVTEPTIIHPDRGEKSAWDRLHTMHPMGDNLTETTRKSTPLQKRIRLLENKKTTKQGFGESTEGVIP